ncbi:M10 family metallopeptidase C-terminal domain-containing protein [Rhizobium sp. G21]|uniref:M10 family metallopeptidase C-terminal domain-containing protein n=1 Tax=Rhizobium sp. G21 TaxID=2758439 RepID=UPI0015FFC2D9|nr:M10 family metallopeptidase C-terminal domain-containing protein [Rhizobium sp. G21]MBB1250787.1 M10 family metallopeptidase C-terminal domain-containing protein [Rhizobium sp. G21]
MLNWNTIAEHDDYAAERSALLTLLEGATTKPYVDIVGVPTIGIGFSLRANLDKVLLAMVGEEHYSETLLSKLDAVVDKTYSYGSSATLISALDKVMAAWSKSVDSDVPKTFAFASSDQIAEALDLISPTYDSYVDKWLSGIPDSDERMALFSLAYNNPGLLGSGLKAAIEEGDRAEAWFQIRYYSNGGASAGEGIANRRYVEADLFGLYDKDGKATFSEAVQTGQMLAEWHEKILSYEAAYDPNEAASVKGVETIGDITEELAPAIRTALKTFGLSAKTEVEELLAADKGMTTVYGDGTSADSSANDADMLIGRAGADTLYGGTGNDILVGCAGRDRLSGGAGDDLFVFSTPKDSTAKASDLIDDFTKGEDQIALTKALDGDYDLLARGVGFSGEGAEIGWRWKGDDTLVTVDRDGDGGADLTFKLDGKIRLTDADFLV